MLDRAEMLNPVSVADRDDRLGESLLDQLELYLQRHLQGRVRNLRLVQDNEGLVLQGHAPTYYAKQLAQHALLGATSLPLVSNEIEVI